jgi:aminoglycoside 6'-N-acetyltransferase
VGTILHGTRVELRPVIGDDVNELARIRATPEVYQRWGGGPDVVATITEALSDVDVHSLTVVHEGRVVGMIQWSEEADPDYRHANIDIFLDPAVHGLGLGTDAVRTLARHLLAQHGHHRLVIDPAADNAAAIRAYEKVGFRPVGIMRRYERGPNGTWHDGLLMDLLADDLIDD